MPDDPFERWREGRPFGAYRLTDNPAHGLLPVPVARDAAHRQYFANNVFVMCDTNVSGPQVQIHFDNLTKQRGFVFLPRPADDAEPAAASSHDLPPPNGGTLRNVGVGLCAVELPVHVAANLARILIEQLAEMAPGALRSAGVEFPAKSDG